jgi:hypothetical protein
MSPENSSRRATRMTFRRADWRRIRAPEVERSHNVVTILICQDDDDRNRGMTLAKLGKYAEAVPVRPVKDK